jgi:hypothetical protein
LVFRERNGLFNKECAMLRVILSLGLVLGLVGFSQAEEKKGKEATITKVDSVNKTITVKCKDDQGKETEKTFKLAEDIRYLDSTGKVAAIEIFKSGHQVLIVEEDGKLKEVRRKDTKDPNPEK